MHKSKKRLTVVIGLALTVSSVAAPVTTYAAPPEYWGVAGDSGCGDENDILNDHFLYDENAGKLIPNHGTTDYDVSHYDIDVNFTPGAEPTDDSLRAKTKVTAKATKVLSEISLDFRRQHLLNVKVNNAPVDIGTNVIQFNDDEIDKQKLIITPPIPIAQNAVFTVDVEYVTGVVDAFVGSGQSPQGLSASANSNGGTGIGEPFGATYWFPNNNTPSDGATYTVTLTGPSTLTGVSNGDLVENTDNSDGTTTRIWEETNEASSYQIIASFGNYKEFAGEITLTDGTKIPTWSYVDQKLYTTPASNKAKVDTFVDNLGPTIRGLEKIGGKYPGTSAGFIFEPLTDGTPYGRASWGAVETKDRPFYLGVTSNNTFVHELAHQWFGDAVRQDGWENLWLNEGFATYVTDVFLDKEEIFVKPSQSPYEKYLSLYNSKDAEATFWREGPANIEWESHLFGSDTVAYRRGAMALLLLHNQVGDSTFFEILSRWVATYKNTAQTTESFVALASLVSGVDLSHWSVTWLYGKVRPETFPEKNVQDAGGDTDPGGGTNPGGADPGGADPGGGDPGGNTDPGDTDTGGNTDGSTDAGGNTDPGKNTDPGIISPNENANQGGSKSETTPTAVALTPAISARVANSSISTTTRTTVKVTVQKAADKVTPTGSVQVSVAGKTVSGALDAQGIATLTLPKLLKAGISQPVKVAFVSSNTELYLNTTVTSATHLTVKKANAAVKKIAVGAIKSGQKAKATVQYAKVAGKYPTGKVLVKVNGKSYKATISKAGKATITTKAIKVKKTTSLKVSFTNLGDSVFAKSTAGSKSFKVIKK